MGPAGGIGCRFWEDDLGRQQYVCAAIPDDDVVGHTLVAEHEATISISWRDEPNGERRIEFTSDDPDAQALLMDLLNRTAGDGSDRPTAAR